MRVAIYSSRSACVAAALWAARHEAECVFSQKNGFAAFLNLVSPVKDLHHVGQCAVFAVADDACAPLLDLGDGIFGRKTDLGNGEHRNIVGVIADAVNVPARNAEQLGEL